MAGESFDFGSTINRGLNKIGIGGYTLPNGQVVSIEDLPPDVRAAVDELSKGDGVGSSAGGITGRDTWAGLQGQGVKQSWGGEDVAQMNKMMQDRINRLYNPQTRDAEMQKYTGEKIVRELSRRMDDRDMGRR